MPPHCDAIDGPVVTAARKALQAGDVNLVLPYVKQDGEAEVRDAFNKVAPLLKEGSSKEVAERYFFETVVRVHRAGEHAPYTGLKPAGLDVGPVIPVAEKSIESGSPDQLVGLLTGFVREELELRHRHAMELKAHAGESVEAAREYVEAMLGLQVWSNNLYHAIKAGAHGEHTADAD